MAHLATVKILIVEDEPAQLELLTYNMEKEGYLVFSAIDGDEGLLVAKEQEPDLIILDWMLPKLSGIEVCRQLKRNKSTAEIPIILLTARGEESDKVRGLDIGADDYMVKPYSTAELLARTRAMIRRYNPLGSGAVLEFNGIVLDTEKFKVTRNGQILQLGPTEYRLLSVFMGRPGRVWGREQLLDRVWGEDSDIDFRTVDVHVGRLRKTLTQKNMPDVIRTVRSAGYSLDIEN